MSSAKDKRIEIREGIRNNILTAIDWANREGMTEAYLELHIDELLNHLHSQGVVIKVDGKPYIPDKTKHCGNEAVTVLAGSPMFYCFLGRSEFPKKCKNCPDFQPTELVAVEPLIGG